MLVEETLPRAKALVEEGERRLLAQEARVAELGSIATSPSILALSCATVARDPRAT
jgi:hypothetical protein